VPGDASVIVEELVSFVDDPAGFNPDPLNGPSDDAFGKSAEKKMAVAGPT